MTDANSGGGGETNGVPARNSPLKALILGGTGFIGPHLVSTLRERGHQITLFDRVAAEPAAAVNLEVIVSDRNEIDAIRNRNWDVVIDASGFVPRHVGLTAEALQERVGYYIFISSICAYRDFAKIDIQEDYSLATPGDLTCEEINGETYGPFKALCEQIVEQTYGARATVLRPTYVVGPGDASDRFTYWPVRVAGGGTMLVPGKQSDPIQYIDVRDLAEFICRCAEQQIIGRYNVCTPAGEVTMGELLETSRQLTGSHAKFVWAELGFLPDNHRIGGGGELTIWGPRGAGFEGWPLISTARAVAKGLQFRKLEVTVRDTLAWHHQRPAEQREKLRAGMTPEREVELLRQTYQTRFAVNCAGDSGEADQL